jgi:hypothetical protein
MYSTNVALWMARLKDGGHNRSASQSDLTQYEKEGDKEKVVGILSYSRVGWVSNTEWLQYVAKPATFNRRGMEEMTYPQNGSALC